MSLIVSRTLFVTLLVFSFGAAAFGQGAVPLGGEFEVNTYTTSDQGEPAIAHLADGGFVVAWRSLEPSDTDPYESNVRAQRFGADGDAIGEEFQVNSDIPGGQASPAVAGLTDGGFVILWHVLRQTGSGFDLQGKIYTSGGTAVGEEFQVNSYSPGPQWAPEVATLPDGGFVVVWASLGSSGSDDFRLSTQARRFGADGSPVADDFQVNTYTTADQTRGAVTALADGGFMVVWRNIVRSGTDILANSVQGQRYSADGSAVGEEFQIDDGLFSTRIYHSIAGLADGGFIVAWSDVPPGGAPGTPPDVRARRFAADSSAAGGSFQVNSYTPDVQSDPSVSSLANGGFVVAWRSLGSSGSDYGLDSIQARRFGADAAPLGGDFQVNSYTALGQRDVAMSASVDGDMAMVWRSADPGPNGSDTSSFGINGQRYGAPRFALARLDGNCLEVGAADGSAVHLGPCRGDEAQTWRLDLTAVPQRVIDVDGGCLLPDFGHPSGEVRAVIGECGGTDDLWRLENPGSSSPSSLRHVESGLCLEAAGDGMPARLLACDGGGDQVWRPAARICTRDYFGPCLNRDRFRIDLDWRSFDGTTGSGKAVQAGADDSGLLWFFEAENWELLVKVLDGCAINDRLWVFAAAATTVEYRLRVTDTATGMIQEYFNPLGNASAAITDANAFATCSAATGSAPQPLSRAAPIPLASSESNGPCVPSSTTICLADNRFSAEIEWRDYSGNAGVGTAVIAGSQTSGTAAADTPGLFWFFGPNNWEMLVKVLDACEVNDRFLFLGAATTDIEYTLTVRDLDTGVAWQHTNPLGQPSEALVHWFDTCP